MRYGNDLWCIGGELDGTSEVFHSADNTTELLQEGRADLATRPEIRLRFRYTDFSDFFRSWLFSKSGIIFTNLFFSCFSKKNVHISSLLFLQNDIE